MDIKVMTYNICSGHNLKYESKLNDTIEVIRKESPDILGLNEVDYKNKRCNFVYQCKIIADSLGYGCYYFGKSIDFQGGEYGNALLTRYPIIEVETVPVPLIDKSLRNGSFEPRSHIHAVVNADGKLLTVLVSHYGLSVEERLNAVNETLRLTDKAETPVLFMGDLNAEPDFAELQPLMKALSDTGRTGMLTFPSDTPNIKIDYIFTSRDINTVDAYVPVTQASDHRPYVAVLSIN